MTGNTAPQLKFEIATRETLPEDLAVLPMDREGMDMFIVMEDDLEFTAKELIRDGLEQESADAFVVASNAYANQGFYIKAASLKGEAARLYGKAGQQEVACLELLNAIDLERLANRFSKMRVEILDHKPKWPIRANYPDLHMGFSYNRGEFGRNQLSNSFVIFNMMHDHYMQLFNTSPERLSRESLGLARGGLYEINSELAAEIEDYHSLFSRTRVPSSRGRFS